MQAVTHVSHTQVGTSSVIAKTAPPVKVVETTIRDGEKVIGRIAVFQCDPTVTSPISVLDEYIREYVRENWNNEPRYEYIDSNYDDPWTRVVLNRVNDLLNIH
jgi:hypothetical protein